MIKYAIVLALIALGCSSAPKPTPHPPDDTPSCAGACAKIGPDGLNCEEGKPADDGTSCQKFCEDTQNSGHALNPSCIMASVKACKDIQEVCGQ